MQRSRVLPSLGEKQIRVSGSTGLSFPTSQSSVGDETPLLSLEGIILLSTPSLPHQQFVTTSDLTFYSVMISLFMAHCCFLACCRCLGLWPLDLLFSIMPLFLPSYTSLCPPHYSFPFPHLPLASLPMPLSLCVAPLPRPPPPPSCDLYIGFADGGLGLQFSSSELS